MKIEKTIYLDHQASTPVNPQVFEEMRPFFTEFFGNPHSVDHYFGWRASQAVETAALKVAKLIDADPDEIIFTSGATEANNLAILGVGKGLFNGNRRRLLISQIEHKCIFSISQVLEDQFGFKVERVPVDHEGFVCINELEGMLDEDVLLVSIMAVNNEIGTIQDIEKLSQLTKKYGAIFHCDAAQAPCAIDLSSFSEFVDLLSLSAHKFNGPKGIGALFIRRELQDKVEPLIYGGGQQQNLRSGTVPVALCVGMGAAAMLWNSNEGKVGRDLLRDKREYFVKELMKLRWPISINGPKGENRHPGNVNACFKGFSAHDILSSIQPHLAASTGSACTSGIPEPSHVLKAINLSNQEIEGSIRFSLGREETMEELDEAINILEKTLLHLEKEGLVNVV